MNVINFNTAKIMRNHNFTPYLLSDAKPPASDFRVESEFVYKTTPFGIRRDGACIAQMPRKPLRLIVARFPEFEEIRPGYFIVWYRDTLSCSHQVHTFSGEESKKRRGCQECLDAISLSERKAA